MSLKPRSKYNQYLKRNAVLLCVEPRRAVAQVIENLGNPLSIPRPLAAGLFILEHQFDRYLKTQL